MPAAGQDRAKAAQSGCRAGELGDLSGGLIFPATIENVQASQAASKQVLVEGQPQFLDRDGSEPQVRGKLVAHSPQTNIWRMAARQLGRIASRCPAEEEALPGV